MTADKVESAERLEYSTGTLLHCSGGSGMWRLVSHAGAPVWPCRDRDDFERFQAALQPFGIFAEWVSQAETVDAELCEESEQSVLALGAENTRSAELYAHLTGRRVVTIDSVAEIATVSGAAVLIATWDQLNVPDLNLIYEHGSTRRVIGLIVGETDDALFDQIRVSAAHTLASRDPAGLRKLPSAAIVGLGKAKDFVKHFNFVSSENAGPEAIGQLLGRPISTLGFIGHSDGIDARLSSRVVLCTRKDPTDAALDRRPPNCDLTGYCHRRHLSRADALELNQLLSPRLVACRVFLMMSCYIARPPDCSVHPEHGLLARLLRSLHVGAIVAPWDIVFSTTAELVQLGRLLATATTIGVALERFYLTAQGAVRGSNRYLLFGDPEIRTRGSPSDQPAVGAADQRPDAASAVGPAQTEIDDGAINPIPWLKARIDRLGGDHRNPLSGKPRVSEELLDRARSAILKLDLPQTRQAAYRDLLRAILSFEGSGFVHWLEDSRGVPEFVDRPTFCFGCSAKGRLYRVNTSYGSRWMACCTQCDSFYADTPEGSDQIDGHFAMRKDGSVEHSLPPFCNMCIGMNLRSSLELRTTWMMDEPFNLISLPPGRSWIWLHALSDRGMYSYSRMIDNRPIGR